MKHKKLLIAGITVFTVIVFLATFIVIWLWGDDYPDFEDFTKSVAVPGLEDDAVPQGITNYTGEYIAENENGEQVKATQEYMIFSAYMKDGASRLYVTGRTTGYVGYVTLENEDGSEYTGHAGGVATSCRQGDRYGTLWVVSDGTVYCAKTDYNSGYTNIADELIARAAMKDGENVIRFTASFKANNKASFCYFYDDGTPSITDDRLYVGEFYLDGYDEYQTDHKITNRFGNEQHALVYEYNCSNETSNVYGLQKISSSSVADENKVPRVQNIYSLPEKIQGFARITGVSTGGGKLVLSQSYALSNSSLLYYNWEDIYTSSNRKTYATLTGKNFTYEGVETKSGVQYTESTLNVYFTDNNLLQREYSVPSMSEGLCANGDRVYVLFESGCYKYRLFVRQSLTEIFCFTPRKK